MDFKKEMKILVTNVIQVLQEDPVFMQSFLELNEKSSETVDHSMDVMFQTLGFVLDLEKYSPELIRKYNLDQPNKLADFLSALL